MELTVTKDAPLNKPAIVNWAHRHKLELKDIGVVAALHAERAQSKRPRYQILAYATLDIK
jgi:hypothetical protein